MWKWLCIRALSNFHVNPDYHFICSHIIFFGFHSLRLCFFSLLFFCLGVDLHFSNLLAVWRAFFGQTIFRVFIFVSFFFCSRCINIFRARLHLVDFAIILIGLFCALCKFKCIYRESAVSMGQMENRSPQWNVTLVRMRFFFFSAFENAWINLHGSCGAIVDNKILKSV